MKGSIVFSAGTDNQATAFNGKSEEAAPSGLLVGTGLIRKTVKENNTEKEVVVLLCIWKWEPGGVHPMRRIRLTAMQ